MTRKKLTMCQIAGKVALGEIPEGYYVKWIGNPPGRAFEDYADGDGVMIAGVGVPQPDGIVVKGAYVVDIERYMNWEDEKVEKIDFGPVYVFTRFELDDLKFLYKKERKKEVEDYMNSYMYRGGKFAMKKDFVFNVKYESGDRKGTLMNAFIKVVTYPKDDGMIEVKLVCDYINRFID